MHPSFFDKQQLTGQPTMKSTIRQYLHDLKIHAKQMYPESGNTVEPQSSSSSPGCKLEKVRALFPLLLQCPEKVPETGNIAYMDPNRPRFSFEQGDDKHISVVKRKFSFDEGDDRHLFFVKPRRPPIQFKPACELKRVSPLYSSATSTLFPRVF